MKRRPLRRPDIAPAAEAPGDRLYIQVYPSSLVNASRMMKIARSVHTRSACFDETQLPGVREAGLPDRETVATGVSIIRLPGTVRGGAAGQVLRALFWQPRVFWRYRSRPLAMVAAHNVWVLPMCWLLSRHAGASLAYNAHELETETGSMRGVRQRMAKLIERRLVPRCDVVSVVNEPIADWYEQHYPISRPIVVGNAPEVRDADVGLRAQLGIGTEEMLYVFTGHLTFERNIPLILQSFEGRRQHVVFFGDGPLRAQVERAAETSSNIHWIPPVPPELIVAYVREADVGLCLIDVKHDLSNRLSSPNKLMEALAAGIPALCTDLVEARRLLGPLASDWITTDPQAELAGLLDRLGKHDVAAFRARSPEVVTWDEAIEPLIQAYRQLASATPKSVSH